LGGYTLGEINELRGGAAPTPLVEVGRVRR